jgi:hypothetical protein
MITALMVLVCAVLVVGWVMAGIAFVASVVSMFPRLHNRSGTSSDRSALPRGSGWPADDNKSLRDVGIQP